MDTQFVRVVFFISNKGIRGYVIDIPKEYVANPLKYLEITEPIVDFVELRKVLVHSIFKVVFVF